jgi:hypothetical protein
VPSFTEKSLPALAVGAWFEGPVTSNVVEELVALSDAALLLVPFTAKVCSPVERSSVLILRLTDLESGPPPPKLTLVGRRVAALEGIVLDWNDRSIVPEPCPDALDTVTEYVAVSPLVSSADDGLTEIELTYGKAQALWKKNGPTDNAEEIRITINDIEIII